MSKMEFVISKKNIDARRDDSNRKKKQTSCMMIREDGGALSSSSWRQRPVFDFPEHPSKTKTTFSGGATMAPPARKNPQNRKLLSPNYEWAVYDMFFFFLIVGD